MMSMSSDVGAAPARAAWFAQYEDGCEKLEVALDIRSKYCADRIMIRGNGSDNSSLYLDWQDVPWLIERLQRAYEIMGQHFAFAPDPEPTP